METNLEIDNVIEESIRKKVKKIKKVKLLLIDDEPNTDVPLVATRR